MQNYDRALELESVATESAGSAMEKYGIYVESTEAKLNQLKATWTELASDTLNSDAVKSLIDISTQLLDILDATGGLVPILTTLLGIFIQIKAQQIGDSIAKIGTVFAPLVDKIKDGITALKVATGKLDYMDASLTSYDKATKTATASTTSFAAALGAVIAVASIVVMVVNAIKQAQEDAYNSAIEISKENIAAINEQQDAINDLEHAYINEVAQYGENAEQSNNLQKAHQALIDVYDDEKKALDILNGTYEENTKAMLEAERKADEERLKEIEKQLAIEEERLRKAQRSEVTTAQAIGLGLSVYGTIYQIKTTAEANKRDLEELVAHYEAMRDEYASMSDDEKKSEHGKALAHELEEQETTYRNIKSLLEEQSNIKEDIAEIEDGTAQKILDYEKSAREFTYKTLNDQVKSIDEMDAILADIEKNGYWDKMDDASKEIFKNTQSTIKALKERDFLVEALDERLDLLEEQRKLEEDIEKQRENQRKIEEAELKVQEAMLDVEEARAKLAEARQKKVSAFRIGKGFTYVEDVASVQNAQDALADSVQAQANAIQNAMDIIKEVNGTTTEQMIRTTQAVRDLYEVIQAQQAASDSTEMREYFRNADNLFAFSQMTPEEQIALLLGFSTDADYALGKVGITKTGAKSYISDPDLEKYYNELVGLEATGAISTSGKRPTFTDIWKKYQLAGGASTAMNTASVIKSINNSNGTTISIGNISLPNVEDADGFVKELSNFAYKV